jgi:hypothetical protein
MSVTATTTTTTDPNVVCHPQITSLSSTNMSIPNNSYQLVNETKSSASSIRSEATTLAPSPYESRAEFKPTHTLHIHAHGMPIIRLPLPSSELVTPVYDSEGNICYASKRMKACSSSAVLYAVDKATGHETAKVETTYFFGPGKSRRPLVKIFEGDEGRPATEVVMQSSETEKGSKEMNVSVQNVETMSTLSSPAGASATEGEGFRISSACRTRACTFELPTVEGSFEWRHERTKLPSGEKAKILALYWNPPTYPSEPSSSDKSEKKGKGRSPEPIRIAQLVRSESTRTPGTYRSYAGNGGVLELSAWIRGSNREQPSSPTISDVVDQKLHIQPGSLQEIKMIDESAVVATCMVMLKKEMDRRRALQFAVIVGAAGS